MGEKFIRKFQIPDVARDYVDLIFTKQEIAFVEEIGPEVFSREDVAKLIPDSPDTFIQNSYRRGLLSIVDAEKETWKVNNFYCQLDVFVVTQQDLYRQIPEEDRRRIDAWYFEEFCAGLDPDPQARPTSDEILTLDEMLDFIDSQGDRPVYLNYCDCRSLLGDCGLPTRTCITYKDGVNTFAHRGLSERIDKERAKEIVRDADKKGLMHTANPNGLCNCCGDCCYLFRGQRRRGSTGFWPLSRYRVSLQADSCIGCGKCARRCHFGVLEKVSEESAKKHSPVILKHPESCVGCGICATGCPTGSLTMTTRACDNKTDRK